MFDSRERNGGEAISTQNVFRCSNLKANRDYDHMATSEDQLNNCRNSDCYSV